MCQPLTSLWPFTRLAPISPCLFYWGAHNWTQHSTCLITSLDLLVILFIMHSRLLAFFTARMRCWLMFNFMFTRTPRSSSTNLLSSPSVPSTYWCGGYFLQLRDFAFPFAELHKTPVGPFVVPVSGVTTIWCINYSSWFCIIWKIAEYALCPITRSLMMTLSSTGPTINPWGTPLVTDLQLDFVLLIITFWDWQLSQLSAHLIVCLSSPAPLFKAGSARQIAEGGDSTASPSEQFQHLSTPTVDFFLLMFKWDFLCFHLCPLPLALSLDNIEKSLALSYLLPLSVIYT